MLCGFAYFWALRSNEPKNVKWNWAESATYFLLWDGKSEKQIHLHR